MARKAYCYGTVDGPEAERSREKNEFTHHSHLLRRVGSRVVGVAVGVVVGVVARVVSGERSGERGKRSGERAGVRAKQGAPALPPATSRARGCRQIGTTTHLTRTAVW